MYSTVRRAEFVVRHCIYSFADSSERAESYYGFHWSSLSLSLSLSNTFTYFL
jgi:hypothetical protein